MIEHGELYYYRSAREMPSCSPSSAPDRVNYRLVHSEHGSRDGLYRRTILIRLSYIVVHQSHLSRARWLGNFLGLWTQNCCTDYHRHARVDLRSACAESRREEGAEEVVESEMAEPY